MHTNTDITIYNKYYDKATRLDKYQRTVLKGVFLDERKGYNRLKSGLESADEVLVLIPFSVTVNRQYLSPMEFQKVENKENYFTIAEEDRLVKGIVDTEITLPKDLDKEHEAYTITTVDTHDYGSYHMRHWELGGK